MVCFTPAYPLWCDDQNAVFKLLAIEPSMVHGKFMPACHVIRNEAKNLVCTMYGCLMRLALLELTCSNTCRLEHSCNGNCVCACLWAHNPCLINNKLNGCLVTEDCVNAPSLAQPQVCPEQVISITYYDAWVSRAVMIPFSGHPVQLLSVISVLTMFSVNPIGK